MTAFEGADGYGGVCGAWSQAWRPRRPLTVSEWAARKRRLSRKSSREAGQWSNERIPFLRADVKLMPIENATLEEYARWFLERLLEEAGDLRGHGIASIEVRVSSGPGQSAGQRRTVE